MYIECKFIYSTYNVHLFSGTNSIIVYVGHTLLGGFFPFYIYQQERSHLTYLTANLVAVGVWMLIAFYWYSIGFFVKIWKTVMLGETYHQCFRGTHVSC